MTTLVLHPLDTLFFRDGRPYNQDDPSQAEAVSVFPPYPPTVVGAVRAALARAKGWPNAQWPTAELGDGVNWQQGDGPLGPLRFSGPYVVKDNEPLFPAPLCLVRGKTKNGGADVIGRLIPGEPLDCDLASRVCLPVVKDRSDVEGWKVLEDAWLKAAGMQRVLDGSVPDPREDVLKADEIWQREPRAGIQRHPEKRVTMRFEPQDGEPAKGALYAAAHVRLCPGVALAMTLEHGGGDLPHALAPLGGESRSAWLEALDRPVELPKAPNLQAEADGKLRYTVIHITPADLGEDWPGPGETLGDAQGQKLPGRILSACIGRPVRVGGWDGIKKQPLPLRPLIPAGSVWFLEASAEEAKTLGNWHGRAIGRATGWGFGRVLMGRWSAANM